MDSVSVAVNLDSEKRIAVAVVNVVPDAGTISEPCRAVPDKTEKEDI